MGHGAVSLAVAGTANFLDFTTDGFVLYLFASSHPALFQVGCFFLALSVCVGVFSFLHPVVKDIKSGGANDQRD